MKITYHPPKQSFYFGLVILGIISREQGYFLLPISCVSLRGLIAREALTEYTISPAIVEINLICP